MAEGCGGSCPMPGPTTRPARPSFLRRGGWLLFALPLWFWGYHYLLPFAEWVTAFLFKLDLKSHLGASVTFFFFDTPKVLMLLALVVLGVTYIQTFVSPERTRAILAKRAGAWGNLLASLLGIITPFCSCSAVPLFIGFVKMGVPLGVTFSYLVSAPTVNEVALFMLFGMFGWKIALLYAATGVTISFFAGLVIGKLRMESSLEPWVLAVTFNPQPMEEARMGSSERLDVAVQGVRDIVGKVWPYVLAGIAAGALIHGYIPEILLVKVMGKGVWWNVPLAVLIGLPLYSNAAGMLPIVQALIGKGAALGTVLAFMMAVISLSPPETIILRKVLKPRLIGVFVGVVTVAILVVGYLFNAIL